ncbi:MAG: CDP-glucose 4,6-dehydratase, partial [Opitutaceae bacterium]
HVLEPLSAYLWLAACLADPGRAERLAGAFNFGPGLPANKTVSELVEEVFKHWPGRWTAAGDPDGPHEASLLNLSIDRAWHELQWRPVWSFEACVRRAVEWYRAVAADASVAGDLCRRQILAYVEDARGAGLIWTR